jgi:hypothetical protein
MVVIRPNRESHGCNGAAIAFTAIPEGSWWGAVRYIHTVFGGKRVETTAKSPFEKVLHQPRHQILSGLLPQTFPAV